MRSDSRPWLRALLFTLLAQFELKGDPSDRQRRFKGGSVEREWRARHKSASKIDMGNRELGRRFLPLGHLVRAPNRLEEVIANRQPRGCTCGSEDDTHGGGPLPGPPQPGAPGRRSR